MEIVAAKSGDAKELAHLINLAGEGIPEYLWSEMASKGQSALDVGTQRAARDEGGFSYKNARVIYKDEQVAGMIISYQLDEPYEIGVINEYPEVIRPLIELEAMVPGSWYINALASKETCRGLGIASTLLEEAEHHALSHHVNTMSIIVASENPTAKQLYLNKGYQLKAALPVVVYPNCIHGGDWELLVKTL
jgi:ribosomal protein S18 acetylase RimI-like enzyme